MIETRRSSSASKRFSFTSSSPHPTKRSKPTATETTEPAGSSSASDIPLENHGPGSDPGSESGEPELGGSSDPQAMDTNKHVITDVPVVQISPETEVLATPTIASEVVADAEKSKAAKKRASKAPWAKLLSQYPQDKLLVSVAAGIKLKD